MVVSVFILMTASCAPSLIPMDKNEMARVKSEPKVHVATYQPAKFNYSTISDGFTVGAIGALTGGLGGAAYGLAMESRASRFVETYTLQDPIAGTKDNFLSSIANWIDPTHVVQVGEVLSDDSIEALKQKFADGIVLDFKTDVWGLVPAAFSYQTLYAVRARLVRLSDDRILWLGYCKRDGSNSRASHEEFTADSGALMKKKLSEAAESCGKEIATQFLGK
jgi:hypothetical protein